MNTFYTGLFIGYFISILTFSFFEWFSFKFYGLIIGFIIVIGVIVTELIFELSQKSEVKE